MLLCCMPPHTSQVAVPELWRQTMARAFFFFWKKMTSQCAYPTLVFVFQMLLLLPDELWVVAKNVLSQITSALTSEVRPPTLPVTGCLISTARRLPLWSSAPLLSNVQAQLVVNGTLTTLKGKLKKKVTFTAIITFFFYTHSSGTTNNEKVKPKECRQCSKVNWVLQEFHLILSSLFEFFSNFLFAFKTPPDAETSLPRYLFGRI